MSRKKRRQARRSSSRTAKKTSSSEISYGNEFNPDYSYVIKDLKRIGMLAGIFFIILIVLSFIL